MTSERLGRRNAGGLQHAYELDVDPGMVESKIREAIDPPSKAAALIPGIFAGRRFIGRVGGGRFEIWVRRRSYNSLAPRAYGVIEPTTHGSRVNVRIGVQSVTRVGLGLLIALAGLGSMPVLVSIGYGGIGIAIGVALVIFSGLLIRFGSADRGFPRNESAELQGLLDGLLTRDETRPRAR